MPRQHKPNQQERELQKNMDTARGEIASKAAYISDLESRIASLTEQVATLQAQAGESDKLREICKQLGGEILELKAQLDKEKESRKNDAKSLLGTIQEIARESRKQEIENLFLKKTCRGLENQNSAFRATLREVL